MIGRIALHEMCHSCEAANKIVYPGYIPLVGIRLRGNRIWTFEKLGNS